MTGKELIQELLNKDMLDAEIVIPMPNGKHIFPYMVALEECTAGKATIVFIKGQVGKLITQEEG